MSFEDWNIIQMDAHIDRISLENPDNQEREEEDLEPWVVRSTVGYILLSFNLLVIPNPTLSVIILKAHKVKLFF